MCNNDDQLPVRGLSGIDTRSPCVRRRKTLSSEYNLVLLGDLGVGKTALAVRFVTRRYLHEYDPALERCYEKTIEMDGENAAVRLWDTVFKDWSQFADIADGFVVVYAVTSLESFTDAEGIVRAVRTSNGRNYPILLLGNKIDLVTGRVIEPSQGKELAWQHACLFHEISTAQNTNVEASIEEFLRSLHSTRVNAAIAAARKPSNAMHSIKNFLSKIK